MSIGIVGLSAEKRRTTSAVLGPTPGSFISVLLASPKGIDNICVKSPPKFSRTICETSLIVFAFLLYRPATFKLSSMWLFSAFANPSGVIWNWFERFSKALIVFLPEVFCEIMVAISVSNRFTLILIGLGIVNVLRSIFRIFLARTFAIARTPLKTINSE